MFTVYAIKSIEHKFIYVGMTGNLHERLKQHNLKYVISTKRFAPFTLIYSEECADGIIAREKEKYSKSSTGKKFLYSLIDKLPEKEESTLSLLAFL